MGKFGSKLLIYPERGLFQKINYYHLCLSSKPHHSTAFQKIRQRENYGAEGFIILTQIGCESLPLKVIFGKFDHCSNYCMQLC